MKKNIAVLPGDGVGPEVVAEGVKVLKRIAEIYNHKFVFIEGLIGGAAIGKTGNPYPKKTQKLCESSDTILFGAIGDPKYDNDPSAKVRPEQGLLAMRKGLGLYANVRPIPSFPSLIDASPLKNHIVEGVDFVVIRELIGGIYFGKRGRNKDRTEAFDTSTYSVKEIERVAHFAFQLVEKRKEKREKRRMTSKLTLVDKANVLETSRLWRETVQRLQATTYKLPAIEYMFVDNASQQIIKRPTAFDVVLTENMFGDILTDEASVITGSLGMLPSASIGKKTSLYEPIHGSYPKAAGQNSANPIGAILSAAMMLEYSFGLTAESAAVQKAVSAALQNGYGTKDINKDKPLSTSQLGDKIVSLIQ